MPQHTLHPFYQRCYWGKKHLIFILDRHSAWQLCLKFSPWAMEIFLLRFPWLHLLAWQSTEKLAIFNVWRQDLSSPLSASLETNFLYTFHPTFYPAKLGPCAASPPICGMGDLAYFSPVYQTPTFNHPVEGYRAPPQASLLVLILLFSLQPLTIKQDKHACLVSFYSKHFASKLEGWNYWCSDLGRSTTHPHTCTSVTAHTYMLGSPDMNPDWSLLHLIIFHKPDKPLFHQNKYIWFWPFGALPTNLDLTICWSTMFKVSHINLFFIFFF